MNKTIAICCLGVMSVLSTGASAQQQPVRSVLSEMTRQGVIVLGYSPDALPFSMGVGKKTPEGYSIDWCLRIVEHLKTQLRQPELRVLYKEVPPDQMLRTVSTGGVHLMCAAVSDTADRRKSLRFSEPIFHTSVRFMVRKEVNITAASQLAGKSVAVIGRTSAEQAVQTYSDEQKLNLTVSRVVSAEAAMGQLSLKHAQAVARDDVLLLGMRARQGRPADFVLLPEKLGGEPIAIALPNDAELQKMVDQAMALGVRSGAADQLYDKWFVKANSLTSVPLELPKPEALNQAWQIFR